MEKCKVCNEETKQILNIKMKPLPICENCERQIVIQSIVWMYEHKEKSV